MTYEEIVGYVQEKAAKADVSKCGQAAVQIDITGEGEGAFYVAVKEGKLEVAPYEYFDHNAKVVADGNDFVAFLNGKKEASVLTVYGDQAAAEIVKLIADKAPVKKAAKAAEKKAEPAKKAEAKTAEKKAEPAKKVEAKAAEKKAEPAKKAAAKPAAKKK